MILIIILVLILVIVSSLTKISNGTIVSDRINGDLYVITKTNCFIVEMHKILPINGKYILSNESTKISNIWVFFRWIVIGRKEWFDIL